MHGDSKLAAGYRESSSSLLGVAIRIYFHNSSTM